MARRFIKVTAAVVGAATLSLIGAGSAMAVVGDGICDSGEFCAYRDANYVGILLESRAASGTGKVDVADDVTSSVKNRTSNIWVGVTVRTALPDQSLIDFQPNTAYAVPSAFWNDKIDHFAVK